MSKPDIHSLREYELYCDARLANPYPLFHRLREEDPVHWSERLSSWVITRYDDVYTGLRDERLGNDRASVNMSALPEPQRTDLGPLGEHVSNWLGFTDPPKHTRMRSFVSKVVNPKLAIDMKDRIQAIVNELLDRVQPKGHMDAINDFAFALPATVICEVLGIDSDRQQEFKSWLDDITAFVGGVGPFLKKVAEQAYKSQQQLTVFLRELTLKRRGEPRNDMISMLAAVEGQSDGLTEQELMGLCTFLFAAGEETTVSLIGNGIFLLLQHPEDMARLKNQPELMKSAIEEFLRYESPIPISPRLALADVEVRNRCIRKGDAVILMNGSANRDPAQFPDPDRLEIGRTNNKHLAFGWGDHFCLGGPLARMEGQIAIKSILERFPNLRLQEGQKLHWRQNMSIRCLESLPVAF